MAAPFVTDLPAHSELRYEIAAEAPGRVKLISGNAELFGVELSVGREYVLPPGHRGSISTFTGARVRATHYLLLCVHCCVWRGAGGAGGVSIVAAL